MEVCRYERDRTSHGTNDIYVDASEINIKRKLRIKYLCYWNTLKYE